MAAVARGCTLSASATSNRVRLGEEVNGEWLACDGNQVETMNVPSGQEWSTLGQQETMLGK